MNTMSEEIYQEIMKSYSANISETIDLAEKRNTYKNAKALLSAGVSEEIITTTMGLTPVEMQSIKKELGLLWLLHSGMSGVLTKSGAANLLAGGGAWQQLILAAVCATYRITHLLTAACQHQRAGMRQVVFSGRNEPLLRYMSSRRRLVCCLGSSHREGLHLVYGGRLENRHLSGAGKPDWATWLTGRMGI